MQAKDKQCRFYKWIDEPWQPRVQKTIDHLWAVVKEHSDREKQALAARDNVIQRWKRTQKDLAVKGQELQRKDQDLKKMELELQRKDAELKRKRAQLKRKEAELQNKQEEVAKAAEDKKKAWTLAMVSLLVLRSRVN